MNFLAHIYLSFEDPQVRLGNFIGDAVKGRRYEQYPDPVRKGILLHRAIDSFTDSHPITRSSTRRLHSGYSHYSRVIVDIYYDHFLAALWDDYSEVPLPEYTASFYDLLQNNLQWMPPTIQHMAPYMIEGNWLLSYRNLEGIGKVLKGLDRRTGLKSGMGNAILDLKASYDAFEGEFRALFDELVIFSRQKLTEL